MASRFHGKMDDTGPKKGRKNKGVLASVRAAKRTEAELRQAKSDPRKSKAFLRGSCFDPTTGKRRQWKTADWKAHDERVTAYLEKQKVAA